MHAHEDMAFEVAIIGIAKEKRLGLALSYTRIAGGGHALVCGLHQDMGVGTLARPGLQIGGTAVA